MADQSFGVIDVVRGASAVREFDPVWNDGTDRDLSGLTPYLRIYKSDQTTLVNEITGTVTNGLCSFTIPALDPPGVYYSELELRSGATVATDGRWIGTVNVSGRQAGVTGSPLLCSMEDIKAFLSIGHNADDGILLSSILRASKWFESQIGRTVAATDYVEIQDGKGGKVIVPSNYPVISVASVSIDGTAVPLSSAYGTAGYFLSGDLIKLRDTYVTEGTGNVTLSYRAGHETTPADVSSAVTEVAALMYRERDRVGQASRSMGQETVSFYYAPPTRVVSTIEAYRRAL